MSYTPKIQFMNDQYTFKFVGGPLDGQYINLEQTVHLYYEIENGVCNCWKYKYNLEKMELNYKEHFSFDIANYKKHE